LAQNIKKDKKKSVFAFARSKSKVKMKVGPLVDVKGRAVVSLLEMAEEFNTCFASTFTEEDVNHVPDADDEIAQQEDGLFRGLQSAEPFGWIKCFTWCSRTRYMTRYMT